MRIFLFCRNPTVSWTEMKSHTAITMCLINVIGYCRIGSQLMDDVNSIMSRLSTMDELLTHHMRQHHLPYFIVTGLNKYMRYLQVFVNLPINNKVKVNAFEEFLMRYPEGPKFLSIKKSYTEMKRDFHCSANTVVHIKLKLARIKTRWIEAYKSILNRTCPHFSVKSCEYVPPEYRFR